MAATVAFWDPIAGRYAARPIKDVAACEAMLDATVRRPKPTDNVLEIGCGTGSTAIWLTPHAVSWIATEFSAEMLRIAKAKPAPENLRFVRADADSAFDGGPFDAICAFQVLHLVDDLPGLLSRIHERLKPGGLQIAKTWCFADLGFHLRGLFLALRALNLFSSRQRAYKASVAPGHRRRRFRDRGGTGVRPQPARPLHGRPETAGRAVG